MSILSVMQREAERQEAETPVPALCAQARAEGQITVCEPLVVAGDAAPVLVAAARERQADMIVVGGHGKTSLRTLLLGHVAENVIGRAHCAVLIVTAQEDAGDSSPDATGAAS